MPEYIGPVEIPEISTSGSWPITLRFGMATVTDQRVAVHRFGSNDTLTEQRFIVGNGARRISIRYDRIPESEYDALLSFYSDRVGSYQPFLLDIPRPDGTTEQLTVRFASPILSLDQAEEMVYSGTVELIEEPTTTPTYTVSATQTRFPSSGLQTALLAAVQEIIPLITITAGAQAIRLSDRRVTVGDNLYQPRLLDWQPVTQSLGGASDSASFTLGNADRVFTDLVNLQDLTLARVDLSLFHVGQLIKLDFWSGHITGVEGGDAAEFRIHAADALYEMRLPYPRRTIDPQDGFSLPNQPVNVGGKKGIAGIRATSVANDSAYGKPLRDIYVSDAEYPMPVECDLIAGRDESEFYAALGVVGRGPISGYASGDERWRHLLDGQPNHGPGALGLRRSYGGNPTTGDPTATDNSPDSGSNSFALDETGQPLPSNPLDGVAFLQIRRTDDKGIQPARVDTHKMTAYISGGLGCWTWAAPGSRAWTASCVNPVWIAVNVLLRGLGLETASAATQEAVFDCAAAISAAATCDTSVTPIIGDAVSETQFKFTGRIEEQRPLREWIGEILNCALGYSSFVAGKLRVGVRINSSVVEAFSVGNVVYGSVGWSAAAPQYNSIRIGFADRERGYAQYQVHHRDADAIARVGQETQASLDVPGVATKSQAARLAITRLREELGGLTEEEQRKAGRIRFRTTILALNTEPGQVCSLTHPSIPGGAAEFRVTSWQLNPDWSVDIEGQITTDSMYDYTVGDKPADIQPDPLPEIDRQDLYPGDVTLGTITQAVVEDSNGVKLIELSIPYTPPSVTRGFVGVAVRVERPGIKSEVYDFDYSETAPNQDTEKLRLEPPSTSTESWTVKVTSRSNVLRRPFTASTPSQTLSVDPVEAIATGGVPIPDQPIDATGITFALGPTQLDPIGREQYQRLDWTINRALPADADRWNLWLYQGSARPSVPADWYRATSIRPDGSNVATWEEWIQRLDAAADYVSTITAAGPSYDTPPTDTSVLLGPLTVPAIAAAPAPASWSVTLEYSDEDGGPGEINGFIRGRYAFSVVIPASPNTAAIVVENKAAADTTYKPLSGQPPLAPATLQAGGTFAWDQGPWSPESWQKPTTPMEWDVRCGIEDHRGIVTYHATVYRITISAGGGFQVSELTGKLTNLAVVNGKLAAADVDGLLNPSFEQQGAGWTVEAGAIDYVTDVVYHGTYAARLNLTTYTKLKQLRAATAGRVYKLRARVKTNSASGTVSIVVAAYDAAGSLLGYEAQFWAANTDWSAPTPVALTTPANTAQIAVYAQGGPSAGGYMWVDLVELTSLPSTSGGLETASDGTTRIADLGVTVAKVAADLDPPLLSATLPGSIYLGKRYVTYSGVLYEWAGSAYRKVVNSTSIKAELAVDKLTSNHLASNSAVFGIVAAGAIGADQMRAVEFLLKGDGTRPPRWLAKKADNSDVAMIGSYGGEDGLWSINGRFGGSWASPKAQFSSTAAALSGVDFTLVKNGITTSIKNEADPLQPSIYGLSLTDGVSFAMHAPDRFYARTGNALAQISPGAANFKDNLGQDLFSVLLNTSEVVAHKAFSAYAGMTLQQTLAMATGAVLTHASRVMIDASRNIGFGSVNNSDTGIVRGITEYRSLSIPSDLAGGADLSDVINTLNALLQTMRANPPITSLSISTVQKWIAGYTAQLYTLNYEGKIPVVP